MASVVELCESCQEAGTVEWYGQPGARAYNRESGAELPSTSRGRAPGRGVPPKAENFLAFERQKEFTN